MPNWLRALIAGYGAKKLGGGCFSTILVFVIIWWALGHCGTQQNYNYGHGQLERKNNNTIAAAPFKKTVHTYTYSK